MGELNATRWWPYAIAGYAGPIALAAIWLRGSAYDILGIVFWALFGIWALQLTGSLAWVLWRRLR
jgi:hypothetical protein